MVIDLASKMWAHAHLNDVSAARPLQFAVIMNRGAAWGLGSSSPAWVIGAEAAATLAAIWWMATRVTRAESVAAAAVVGGAAANLVDRAEHGAVTDWIHIAPYPAYFNAADIAVRVGLITGALLLLHRHRSEARTRPRSPARSEWSGR
jgi:signal peptidase II